MRSRASRRPNCCCRNARRVTSRSPIRGPKKSARRRAVSDMQLPEARRLRTAHESTPQTHLLSNGRYSVMLTGAGSGYSRWHDLAVTRWREDRTRDDSGSYFFLRDIESGAVWSAGYQPSGVEPDSYEVTFTEDRAEFIRTRRCDHHDPGSGRFARGRRRGSPHIDCECRQPNARPGGHILLRARACAPRRRYGASGILKALRADRVPGEGGRDPGDAATALARRSGNLGGPSCGRRRRDRGQAGA